VFISVLYARLARRLFNDTDATPCNVKRGEEVIYADDLRRRNGSLFQDTLSEIG
jgi:hypothetical protein